MATINVTWLQKFQFVGTDSTKHSVVISAMGEENGTGMRPSDLLLVSLGACAAYDVVNILKKKRKKLVHVSVEVDGTQLSEPPWAFIKIHVHYVVVGENLSERDVARAIHLSHDKHCSVSVTLRDVVDITTDYEVLTPEQFDAKEA